VTSTELKNIPGAL